MKKKSSSSLEWFWSAARVTWNTRHSPSAEHQCAVKTSNM